MKWEYKQVCLKFVEVERILNELGEQGWEVVGYSVIQEGVAYAECYILLKRPK